MADPDGHYGDDDEDEGDPQQAGGVAGSGVADDVSVNLIWPQHPTDQSALATASG